MPLTPSGKKVKKKMAKTYGAKKGEEVFYASMNKHMKGSEMWHESDKSPLARYGKKKK